MAGLEIYPIDEQPVRGNLRAHVAGDKLLMPKEAADAFQRAGLRTAEDLISYMQAFPSAVAATLHWSLGEVNKATVQLKRELRGHVDDQHLQSPTRPNPPLGAVDPDQLP